MVKYYLEPYIFILCTNQNGLHIIINLISNHPYNLIEYIYENIVKNYKLLCIDKFGCCVIQKCFEVPINHYVKILINLIEEFALYLSNDDYGSYAILKILQTQETDTLKRFMDKLVSNICKGKLTNNYIKVIEKSLEYIGSNLINYIAPHILDPKVVTCMADSPSCLFGKFFT